MAIRVASAAFSEHLQPMAQSADDPDRAAPIPHRRLAAVYGGYFAFVGAYSPYLSLYLESIGLTASRIGLLIAEMQLMRIFAPNAWAWFADRTGRRVRTLQLSLLAGALTFCGFFGVSSFAGLAVVMGVHAFCSGAPVRSSDPLVVVFQKPDPEGLLT